MVETPPVVHVRQGHLSLFECTSLSISIVISPLGSSILTCAPGVYKTADGGVHTHRAAPRPDQPFDFRLSSNGRS